MKDQRTLWLNKIAKLAVDKASGDPAPHKPLLLLLVCELIEDGTLKSDALLLTGELAFRFAGYWSVVAARRTQKPDIRLPFYHLKSGGFWLPFDSNGKQAVDKKLATHARLNSSFLACLHDKSFREQAKLLLVSRYFRPAERIALSNLIGIEMPSQNVIQEALPDLELEAAARAGREQRFRLNVVGAYNYTCALTRYRILTINSGSIVDGAHIHKFADSRNNDPTNGVALSKNAHWLFDAGLWSIRDDFTIAVAHERFDESGTDSLLLRKFEGKQIFLPADKRFWPSRVHLAWHRSLHAIDS